MKTFNYTLLAAACVAQILGTSAPPSPTPPPNEGIAHGAMGNFDGKEWKYHQIQDGIFRGIDTNDCNYNFHTANHAKLNATGVYTRILDAFSSNNSLLDKVDLLPTCKTLQTCIRTVAEGTRVGLGYTYQAIINFANAANNNRGNLWLFFNKPFVATLIGSGGWVSFKKPTVPPASCSLPDSDVDAITTAFASLVNITTNNPNSITLTITLSDGSWVTLSMEPTLAPSQGQCGAQDTTGH